MKNIPDIIYPDCDLITGESVKVKNTYDECKECYKYDVCKKEYMENNHLSD